jgi:D-3-phosphoglycerate dehydrogenase
LHLADPSLGLVAIYHSKMFATSAATCVRRNATASRLLFTTPKHKLNWTIRTLSDVVEVEHGRGPWRTYGDVENYQEGKYQIKTFNKISPKGLSRFPDTKYDVRGNDAPAANAHAILLRSHKLQEEEVALTVRAIARYVGMTMKTRGANIRCL